MSKRRTGDPFMPAKAYSATLPKFTANLVVRDVAASMHFYRDVLGAEVRYQDPDFAALTLNGLEFMVHADHTYDAHSWHSNLENGTRRGFGVELRILGIDPDDLERRAFAAGTTILHPAVDKGHGMREVMVQDLDGYTWVLGVMTKT